MAPKRASLTNFSPKPQAQPPADGGKVIQEPAEETATTQERGKKYEYFPVTVYLTKEEKRTLKLVSIDTEQKISEIGATAIREWMERNGHARSGKRTSDA